MHCKAAGFGHKSCSVCSSLTPTGKTPGGVRQALVARGTSPTSFQQIQPDSGSSGGHSGSRPATPHLQAKLRWVAAARMSPPSEGLGDDWKPGRGGQLGVMQCVHQANLPMPVQKALSACPSKSIKETSLRRKYKGLSHIRKRTPALSPRSSATHTTCDAAFTCRSDASYKV